MSRELRNLNDFSGGLNSASDPKDLDENQFNIFNNLDTTTSGQLKILGNPTDENNYASVNTTITGGKGLFAYNSPYGVQSITTGGGQGMSIVVANTTQPVNGVIASSNIHPEFSVHEKVMGSPVAVSAFAYDETNLNQTITNGCTAIKGTGVLINNDGGYSAGTQHINVDTVDATTKFKYGDMVLLSDGTELGHVSGLTSTTITIGNKNISNDLSDSEGFYQGILNAVDNNAELYLSRAINVSVDNTGATLLVPGQRVHGTNIPENTFITKVRRHNKAVNENFDDAIALGTGNAQWQDEDQDSGFNSQLTQDTGSNGYNGANSMKFTLDGSVNGIAWYKMTDCVVGKTYNASIRVNLGETNNSITTVRIGANATTFSASLAAGGSTNWAYYGQSATPVSYANKSVARTLQVNFVPSATTYYVGILVNGVASNSVYIDKFKVKSRWFVDRIEVNYPVTNAFSSQTLKFEKVMFHDLCIYDGLSMNSTKNWLGANQLIVQSQNLNSIMDNSQLLSTEIVEGISDYPTMIKEMVSLINGTNETLPSEYSDSTHLSYGQDPVWVSTHNLAWFGKKGNVSSTHEAIDMEDGTFVFKGKATGADKNCRIRFSTYWNPINYSGELNIQHRAGIIPSSLSKVADYRAYHKPDSSLWSTNLTNDNILWPYNKNIPTHRHISDGQNQYYTSGIEFMITGANYSFAVDKQWSAARMANGVTTSTQVTTLTPSGTVEAGDKLTVVINDNPTDNKVEVTASGGSPTLASMMTSSSGGLANALAADSEIDALVSVAYNSSGDIVTLTSKTAGAAGAFDVAWSIIGTRTEYVDDKFLVLLDAACKIKWNSSVAGYNWIHHPDINETAIWSNVANTEPVFFADGGKLRIAEGNFENNNPTKAFKYISRSGLFPGTGGGSGLTIEKWHLWEQRIKWSDTEAGGKGLRVDVNSAPSPADKTMDIQIEVDSGTITTNSMDSDATTTTFTAPAGHGLIVGDQIDITGSSTLDGRYTISSVSTNTIGFLHGFESEPADSQEGTYFKVGTWEETYKFYASSFDMDDNETLPEHIFTHSGGSETLSLTGRQLKFSIKCDPGATTTESTYISSYITAGYRIYMSKSIDGYGEKWKLFEINFEDGLIRSDNQLITPWTQDAGDVVHISGGVQYADPVEIQTFETHNGFSSNNTNLEARYKTIAISGRRAFLGNVYYNGQSYNDRMIVSPFNMLDVYPTPYGILEVTANDGQSITVLKAYGDSLLQFKSAYLYVINIGSGDPSTYAIVAAHRYYGCRKENHVVETPIGIIWANQSSVYLYNGVPDDIVDLFKYAPKNELGETQKGITGEDRTTRKIKISDWSNFYNDNMIVGFDPKARLVIFKKSFSENLSDGGDCYIYNIDNDTWTFANRKWAQNVKSTNFVTDLDETLVNIAQTSIGQEFNDGGNINYGGHNENETL